jgi:hypothetical protein
MVAGPDAMVVRGGLMRLAVAVIVVMVMGMPMIMPVRMPMRMQCVIVRHAESLARYPRKIMGSKF